MIRLMSILAITAICATTLVVDFAKAQNEDACPPRANCPATDAETAAVKKVQWQNGLFKMVKLKASATTDPSAEKDEERKHENEIRVEIGIDASNVLSSLPLLKNLFQKKPEPEVQSGIRIQFSDGHTLPGAYYQEDDVQYFSRHPQAPPVNNEPGSMIRTVSYTMPPLDDPPKCCPVAGGCAGSKSTTSAAGCCPAASGGCCARPDPFCLPQQGCVTGESGSEPGKSCCDNAKGCCDTAKGCCDTAKGCCGNAVIHVFGTGPKSPGPCMHWVAEAGNDCPACLAPPAHCLECPMNNCETAMSSNVMLASFAEPASIAGQQRMQYMEELLELRVQNAELKVAMAAAERHVEMLQRMSDLREQNAVLRAELHRYQTMNAQHAMPPGPHAGPGPQVNRRPDMVPAKR